jgi:hypothetical protein
MSKNTLSSQIVRSREVIRTKHLYSLVECSVSNQLVIMRELLKNREKMDKLVNRKEQKQTNFF